eukprot:scaffold2364_cov426-Prasinococcus_capsulatus_cf.AAC.19
MQHAATQRKNTLDARLWLGLRTLRCRWLRPFNFGGAPRLVSNIRTVPIERRTTVATLPACSAPSPAISRLALPPAPTVAAVSVTKPRAGCLPTPAYYQRPRLELFIREASGPSQQLLLLGRADITISQRTGNCALLRLNMAAIRRRNKFLVTAFLDTFLDTCTDELAPAALDPRDMAL